jgi:hypothetical protein
VLEIINNINQFDNNKNTQYVINEIIKGSAYKKLLKALPYN